MSLVEWNDERIVAVRFQIEEWLFELNVVQITASVGVLLGDPSRKVERFKKEFELDEALEA
jgi:hypothetical protein